MWLVMCQSTKFVLLLALLRAMRKPLAVVDVHASEAQRHCTQACNVRLLCAGRA